MFVELLNLLLLPVSMLLRRKRRLRRVSPDEIKRFYRSVEWKRARYQALVRSKVCAVCGRSAADGARMNTDHIKPLSKRWDLRLAQSNLQTLCALCNHGKGGR